MAMKRRGSGGTWPSKEARDIAKAVERAGGTVERTGQGHMKVTGPNGMAIVPSRPGNNRLGKAYETIARETGLDLDGP
jgi:hypothetical protein